MILILFSSTLFVSAFLLFWMQLMVAKMILPLLGGSPAVWNTCVCFFQAVLLLGYGYAHLATTVWKPRYQALIHSGVVLLPLPFLPVALASGWLPSSTVNPVVWLLLLLLLSVGVPFFVIATTAPLMQTWFAQTGQASSKDPYFLYAASNLGSLLSLVAYPIAIEPTISLSQQSLLWTVGYGLLTALIVGCAVCVGRSPAPAEAVSTVELGNGGDRSRVSISESLSLEPPTASQQAQWVMLSFLPSSLLLGVTTYLTTDLAAVPLLWAVPLAIYLLTFVLAFARRPLVLHRFLVVVLPLLLAALILLFLLRIVQPIWVVLPLHLLGLLTAALVFHSELARSRPDPRFLTLFYFWIAVGGVLGGAFNAIAAPLLFSSVLEYPLVLLLSILLLQASTFAETRFGLRLGLTLPLALGLLVGGLLIGFDTSTLAQHLVSLGVAASLLLGLRYAFSLNGLKVSVGLVMVLLLTQFSVQGRENLLTTDRSFFGVYRVITSARRDTDRSGTENTGYHSLLHGTTLHGKQSLESDRRREPLTYFSRTGPVGQLFNALEPLRPSRIGVLGLGVGTLAAYATPEQQWTFYEIDPLAKKLALDRRYFTFLDDARAPIDIVLGDGRLALAQAPDRSYDVLFMDAFSSDSIPVHLITQEAVQLYFHKLTDQGVLAVNITNRYLDLEPVLAALAQRLNLVAIEQHDANVPQAERDRGKTPSRWVLLARHAENFGELANDDRWHAIANSSSSVWTDDFSNIFQAVRLSNSHASTP